LYKKHENAQRNIGNVENEIQIDGSGEIADFGNVDIAARRT
jgi:hypothetical protein